MLIRAVLGVVLALGWLGTPCAAAPDAGHDPRRLTASERAQFVPLACRQAVYKKDVGAYRCATLIGYPRATPGVDDFAFDAIAYGGFTSAGAQQAYLSYATLFEPHAFNFGGGVLFERSGAGWRLVRWYPGGQMDECVALPATGRQRLLCRSGFVSEGEVSSAVSVRTVPPANTPAAREGATQVLVSVDDTRTMPAFLKPPKSKCGKLADYKPRVVLIDSLARSTRPGSFAVANLTYVSAREWYGACKTRRWDKIKGSRKPVYFGLANGQVTIDSAVPLERS